MAFFRFVLVGVTVLVLTACGSPNEGRKEQVTKVLNEHYARHCIVVEPFKGVPERKLAALLYGQPTWSIAPGRALDQVVRSSVETIGEFPAAVTIHAESSLEAELIKYTRGLEALVKAGLLSVRDTTVEYQRQQRAAKQYTLTDRGKSEWTGHGFCAGHYKVDEIKRFSNRLQRIHPHPPEPGPEPSVGATISYVTYTYSAGDMSEWTRHPAVREAYPGLDKVEEPLDETEFLILTNDGWAHGTTLCSNPRYQHICVIRDF